MTGVVVGTPSSLDTDSELREFCAANDRRFTNVDEVDRIVYGLADQPGGWERIMAATPRGSCLVLRCGRSAQVRVYDESGATAGSERYTLVDQDEDRYYQTQASPGGSRLVKVSSDTLGDTVPVAVVRGREGPARVAELDQFYFDGGFLRVECSEDLPAEVLAEMLLVGYARVARAIQVHFYPTSHDRADAVA